MSSGMPARGHGSDADSEREVRAPDLSLFKLDILAILSEEARYGLAVKRALEGYYECEVQHGRLYPNLDELVDEGLVTKRELDKRTNEYAITDEGRDVIETRLDWVEARVYDDFEDQEVATDGGTKQTPQDLVREANAAFDESSLGGMMMWGHSGFHTFHNGECDDQTTVLGTALHSTFEEELEMIHADADLIEGEYGEVTPENIAKYVTNEIEEFSAIEFGHFGRENFIETLADNIRDLNDPVENEDEDDAE